MTATKSTLTLRLDVVQAAQVETLKEATGQTSASRALIDAARTWPDMKNRIAVLRTQNQALQQHIRRLQYAIQAKQEATEQLDQLLAVDPLDLEGGAQ